MEKKKKNTINTTDTPEQVQQFYRQVISMPSQNKCKPTLKTTHPKPVQESNNTNLFFCEVCQEKVTQTVKEEHFRTSIHLFNLYDKPKTHFGISEANKGYQLLVNTMNWNEESGLGKEAQGRLYPIPTIFKKDRVGLGLSKGKARITHKFTPEDLSPKKRIRKKRMTKAGKRRHVLKQRYRDMQMRLSLAGVGNDYAQAAV